MRRRPEGGTRGQADGGFTIIELLLVILVALILAALAARAAGRGIRQARMNSAAAQAATALKRARSLAITKGHIHCAAFATTSVVIWEITDEALGVPTDIALVPTAQKERAGGVELSAGTVIVSSQAFVAFLPDGSAWGPGMMPPQEFRVKPDADHDEPGTLDERRIVVGSLSGSVSIMR